MQKISLDQAQRAQQALRAATQPATKQLDIETFVSMIGEELDALHENGSNNQQIADLIREASGIEVTPEQLGKYYTIPHHLVSPHD